MNNILEVKLRYNREKNKIPVVYLNLRKNDYTSVANVDRLISNLNTIQAYYRATPALLSGCLVDVHYNDIIAKSKRMSELLKPTGQSADDVIVGARFSADEPGSENHIITYYVSHDTILQAKKKLSELRRFLSTELKDKATPENFNEPNNSFNYARYSLKKTVLRKLVLDCSVIASLGVPEIKPESKKDTLLITLFQTEISITDLLEKIGIDHMSYTSYGKNTLSVRWEIYEQLNNKIPYMISMVSSDLAKISLDDNESSVKNDNMFIPDPGNEPIIGVIDNLFDNTVYFNKWVESTDYLDCFEMHSRKNADRRHGTEVTSLIVDGPTLNPWLDDHCGRFRVRHFGVCERSISISRLVKKIQKIVNANPDIHVWNLSLGTEEEVSKNFISYDAAFLDNLQANSNVIFVVSGTNDNRKERNGRLRVGSPADSLNSIVVNSVRRDGSIASYSRNGTILSFYNKPDVSYYGGDYQESERITVYSPSGKVQEYGTSFAAPWISRKLCYLIDVMGMSREVAKALIIDASAGWDYKKSTYKNRNLIGYGIVPIDISKIVSSENNEIKFILHGTAQTYKTSNYAIPVPKNNDDKYPYIARATLCYFPNCSRSQGVDYTLRELSLKFGRVKPDGNIEDINDNIQDEIGKYSNERKSRSEFRKWENTKFISKLLKQNKPLKAYKDRLWGLSIISKERLGTSMRSGLNFGIVVTLHGLDNINRIQDFITACSIRGWIVNEITLENKLDIYNANQEEILFEDN